jgi:hypothetical protein
VDQAGPAFGEAAFPDDPRSMNHEAILGTGAAACQADFYAIFAIASFQPARENV